MTTTDHLTRWAATVPVLVEAGCPEPNFRIIGGIVVHKYDGDLMSPDAIAYPEQWFNHTVVPWVFKTYEWAFYPPKYDDNFDCWCWSIGSPFIENYKCPIEAFVRCAEALARIVE